MAWDIINAGGLISPLIWAWGWERYLKVPDRSNWQSRASLLGLLAPLPSGALWLTTLLLSTSMHLGHSSAAVQHLITVGLWIPLAGMLVGLAGRPVLILSIVPSCLATAFFWYATTLP
jgi:hypothetical protein